MSKPKRLRSRKAGLPPGALVHISEIKTTASVFSVIDFYERGLSQVQFPDAASFASHP